MNPKNQRYIFIFTFVLLLIGGFVIVPIARGAGSAEDLPPNFTNEKPEVPPSIEPLVPGNNDSVSPSAPMAPLDISTLTTDFESAEGTPPGFSTGYCAQNGWTAFADSIVEGQISTVNPFVGTQHLSIANDPTNGAGTFVGCFSPDIGVQSIEPNWMEVDVAISGDGGADYHVVPQAPSQGFLSARVNFEYQGNIWILDDQGSGLQFIDTEVAWNIGPYTTLRIEIDPGNNTINYYYGGNLIYSGIVFAGTTIEQVVLFHDNWNAGDVGDFDNLRVYAGTHPTSINLVKMQSLSADTLPFWVLLITLAGIFVPLNLILRRRS